MLYRDKNGCFFNGEEITEDKYNEILEIIQNRPEAPEGFSYRLTNDLEWEMYEKPEDADTDPELTEVEAFNILFGGDIV